MIALAVQGKGTFPPSNPDLASSTAFSHEGRPNHGVTLSAEELPPLAAENYPNALYWYEVDWKGCETESGTSVGDSGKGGGRMAQGENVRLLFVTDEFGEAIGVDIVKQLLDYMYGIWFDERIVLGDHIAQSWKTAGNTQKQHFYREMELRFKELRFCNDHWKSKRIASLNYSQWYGNHVKKFKVNSMDVVEESSKKDKRQLDHSPKKQPPPKKKKKEGQKDGPKIKVSNYSTFQSINFRFLF